jgi:hypothetical protein
MPPTITHRRRAAFAPVALTIVCLALAPAAAAQSEDPGGRGAVDPFAHRSWNLELATHAAVEAWNYNISHEEMYAIRAGLTYGVRDGLAVTAAGPLYYVDQRGVDAWLLGATTGVRGRFLRRGRATAFWEFEVGVSEADTSTPPRGTRFNYLVMGGAGATIRIRPGLHLLAAMTWVHVSNNGLAGRHRNPDIEAVGPRFGLLVGF